MKLKGIFFALLFCGATSSLWAESTAGSKETDKTGLFHNLIGLTLRNESVQSVLAKYKFQRSVSRKEEIFDIDPGFKTASRRKTTETIVYFSSDPPVELFFDRSVLTGNKNEDFKLNLIKIGHPLNGDNHAFAISKSRLVEAENKKNPEAPSKTALLTEYSKGKSYYPFGIEPLMKKDDVTKLLKRGYFSEMANIGADGSGSIDFSSDGPDVPFPVVVWFDRGYVCGVDIKK